MSTAPEMVVESDVTTEIELEAVAEIGHAHVPGAHLRENAPVVRARRHAILLADVDTSLASARPR